MTNNLEVRNSIQNCIREIRFSVWNNRDADLGTNGKSLIKNNKKDNLSNCNVKMERRNPLKIGFVRRCRFSNRGTGPSNSRRRLRRR